MRRLFLPALLLLACDSGGGGGGTSADAGDGPARTVQDAEVDAAVAIDAAPTPPDGAEPDAGATDPDSSAGVADCAAACAHYGACERLDLFGDEAACRVECERASRDGLPADWFACLEATPCGAIESCEVPGAVALDCDAVCGAVEACGQEGMAPDCAARCPSSPGLAACAEHLFDGVCDQEGWRDCLAVRVYPQCAVCGPAAECNIVVEADCRDACLEVALGEDPLARRRSEQRGQCVGTAAGDCFAINQCVDPEAVFGLGHTCLEACEGLQRCGIIAADGLRQCLADCDRQLTEDPAGHQFTIDCTVEFFVAADCDPTALQSCLTLEAPTRPDPCEALCEARALCELEDGVDEAACVTACQDARLGGGDPAWRLQLPCARAVSCPAFAECVEAADPAVACDEYCGALAGCEVAAEDCAARCVEGFGRDRHEAARRCVAEAEGCEALADCVPGEPPPCAAWCERLDACMLGAQPPDPAGCAARCDDDHFADPEGVLSRVACVLGAPVCDPAVPLVPEHAVSSCVLDPSVGEPFSRGCLAWCEATEACAGEGDLAACVAACGAGFAGADALRFAAASECLLGAAGCAELEACIPAEVEVDCEAHCAAVEVCGIPVEGCVDACEAEPDLDAAGCVLDAGTRRRGCAAVADCVGFEAEAPSAACAELCAARAACEEGTDEFACGLRCTPEPPGTGIRAACAAYSDCGGLVDCIELGDEPSDGCVGACAGVDACGVEPAACAAMCTGREASERAAGNYAADAAVCTNDLADGCGQEEVDACFALADECERGCQLLSDCNPLGVVGTPDECRMLMCPNGPVEMFWEMNIRCALEVFDAGNCDENAYLACIGFM